MLKQRHHFYPCWTLNNIFITMLKHITALIRYLSENRAPFAFINHIYMQYFVSDVFFFFRILYINTFFFVTTGHVIVIDKVILIKFELLYYDIIFKTSIL